MPETPRPGPPFLLVPDSPRGHLPLAG